MNILIPLLPQTIDYIRLGRITHLYVDDFKKEYKKLKKVPDKVHVLLYSVYPVNKIVGCVGISKIVMTRPIEAWRYSSNYSGISEKDFFEKYGESKNIFVFYIEQYTEFEEKISMPEDFIEPKNYLKMNNFKTPPTGLEPVT